MGGREKKSKKSSAAKLGSPPDPLVFFVDRSLGRHKVVGAIRSRGATAEAHDDHFAQDTPDVEWLAQVGRRGWIVLSKDARIRTTAVELEVLRAAGVYAFFLTRQNLVGDQMAAIFADNLGKIRVAVRHHSPPCVFTVTIAGRIERVT